MNYGGFWLRLVALIIDSLILGMLQWIVIIPVLGLLGFSFYAGSGMDVDDPESAAGLVGMAMAGVGVLWLLFTAVTVLYFSFMESSKYQGTLGKMALGLVVTDMNGNKLDFSKALVRNLCRIISNLTFLVGYIVAAFTEKRQALHDLIAGTLVLRKNADTTI